MNVMFVPTSYVLCYTGYGRRVWIGAEVARTWNSHRQTHEDATESFGVLVGTTSIDKRQLWLDAVTTPMPLDRRSRCHFELLDPGHQQIVNEAFNRSSGSSIYLGTWHTHPQITPKLSNIDEEDWHRCLQRNQNRPLAFVIVGTESTRVFVRWGRWFKTLRQTEVPKNIG